MKKATLFSLLVFTLCFTMYSCGPSIKTTGVWVNREKLPAEPVIPKQTDGGSAECSGKRK